MWNLIKMDFYRLFSSKTVKMGAVIACLVCAGYMAISFGLIAFAEMAFEADPAAVEGLSFLVSQIAWIQGVDFAEIVFSGTAVFSLFIGCMITANFIGSEQSCGYTKNFAGQLTDKGYMAISKFAVTSFAQLMLLVVYTAVSAALAVLLFGKYIIGYDMATLFAALGLRLLLHLAMNAVVVFICTFTKNHAIAMVAGCIFGLGVTKVAYTAAELVLSILKIDFPISSYMPDGINSQLALENVGELAVKTIAVSVAFMAVFLASNYFVVRRRDVK